jgi:plastocyanin
VATLNRHRNEYDMRRRHWITLPLVATAVGIALTGCGGGDDNGATAAPSTSTSSTAASPRPAAAGAVSIKNFSFVPPSVQVTAGKPLTVTNNDTTAHTATADDGTFDTGTLDPGAAKPVTVSAPGRHAYHCNIHPFMHGTLVVG